MARVRNHEKLLKIYRYIEANPGCSRYRICQDLGFGDTNIEGNLASMEAIGMYLYEDSGGALFAYAYYPGNVLSLYGEPI